MSIAAAVWLIAAALIAAGWLAADLSTARRLRRAGRVNASLAPPINDPRREGWSRYRAAQLVPQRGARGRHGREVA